MTTLLLLTILQAQAQSQADATLPTRPTTFMVDDRLSEGVVENFREVYLNPNGLDTQLSPVSQADVTPVSTADVPTDENQDKDESTSDSAEKTTPTAAASPTAVLPIMNDTSSWAEVVVGDVKVGVIGPLTNGAIRNVQPGIYEVEMTIMTGYSFSRKIQTVDELPLLSPGGESARPALDSGHTPTWNKRDQ